MNEGDFYREMAAQNDYLRAQLLALSRKRYRIRDKFVLHEVRCQRCGDVLVEMVDLDPYPVIRFRSTTSDADTPRREDYPTMTEFAKAHANRAKSIRLEKDWRFFPIAREPSNDDRLGVVIASCRCSTEHEFSLANIRDRAAAGRKSTISPTRH